MGSPCPSPPQASLIVTEELHLITFETEVYHQGLKIDLEVSLGFYPPSSPVAEGTARGTLSSLGGEAQEADPPGGSPELCPPLLDVSGLGGLAGMEHGAQVVAR